MYYLSLVLFIIIFFSIFYLFLYQILLIFIHLDWTWQLINSFLTIIKYIVQIKHFLKHIIQFGMFLIIFFRRRPQLKKINHIFIRFYNLLNFLFLPPILTKLLQLLQKIIFFIIHSIKSMPNHFLFSIRQGSIFIL